MSKWISVKDRLPGCSMKPGSFGTHILIYPPVSQFGHADSHVAFYGCRVTNKPSFYLYGVVLDNVTHWMPLPDPPKEK